MRSYKNLASGIDRPRSVTCVHKSWHLEWNTPGSPGRYARIFGGLLSKHRRYQAFRFFEVESEIRSQVESKTGKKPNGPNRKSNRLTKKKNSTYLVPHWVITWADWCGAKFTLGTNYEPSFNGAAEIQFAARYCRPSESALCKLCININQPYLIWAAVLCRHVIPTKDQGYWDQQSNRPRRR